MPETNLLHGEEAKDRGGPLKQSSMFGRHNLCLVSGTGRQTVVESSLPMFVMPHATFTPCSCWEEVLLFFFALLEGLGKSLLLVSLPD